MSKTKKLLDTNANYSTFRICLESQFKERCVQLPNDKYELIVQQRRRYLLQTGKI